MSICIILLFGISLILIPGINQVLFAFVIAVIVILHSPFFFNAFGLDNTTIDRYLLFPVAPASIIAAKNRATFLVVSFELFPLLLLNLIKSRNIILICYFCLIIISILLIYCLAGNMTSVLLARSRRYSHFGDNKEGGSARIFLAASCWGIILYVNNMLNGNLLTGIYLYSGVSAILLGAFLALKGKFGLLFKERKEELRTKLLSAILLP